MGVKQNCWEFKRCGREAKGAEAARLGVCPAAVDTSCDGLNGGENGGRICWAVAGTFCGGEVQGTFAQKETSCLSCDFSIKVKMEEDGIYRLMKPGQMYDESDLISALQR